MEIDEGFNNIRPWLLSKLRARRLSVNRFSALIGTTHATVFRWLNDTFRPNPQTMANVCEVLSQHPVYSEDGTARLEYVPFTEGRDLYTPKPRTWRAKRIKDARRKSSGVA